MRCVPDLEYLILREEFPPTRQESYRWRVRGSIKGELATNRSVGIAETNEPQHVNSEMLVTTIRTANKMDYTTDPTTVKGKTPVGDVLSLEVVPDNFKG